MHQYELQFRSRNLKGHWVSLRSSPTFSKKVVIFIPLAVLAWIMTACWVLRSRLTYFWRNMSISSIFYFSKSASINSQYRILWDTLKMVLFTKYLIYEMKTHWQNQLKTSVLVSFKILYRIRYKKIDVKLLQCLF